PAWSTGRAVSASTVSSVRRRRSAGLRRHEVLHASPADHPAGWAGGMPIAAPESRESEPVIPAFVSEPGRGSYGGRFLLPGHSPAELRIVLDAKREWERARRDEPEWPPWPRITDAGAEGIDWWT